MSFKSIKKLGLEVLKNRRTFKFKLQPVHIHKFISSMPKAITLWLSKEKARKTKKEKLF